jgi:hypothetical protein
LLAEIAAGEGMSAHYRPIDIVGYMFEESGTISVCKPLEDLENTLI